MNDPNSWAFPLTERLLTCQSRFWSWHHWGICSWSTNDYWLFHCVPWIFFHSDRSEGGCFVHWLHHKWPIGYGQFQLLSLSIISWTYRPIFICNWDAIHYFLLQRISLTFFALSGSLWRKKRYRHYRSPDSSAVKLHCSEEFTQTLLCFFELWCWLSIQRSGYSKWLQRSHNTEVFWPFNSKGKTLRSRRVELFVTLDAITI